MERPTVILLVMAFIMAMGFTAAVAGNEEKPPSGWHYNLNIIGFANCEMDTGDEYPDCYKGSAPFSNGHRIFVPLVTAQDWDICDEGSELPTEMDEPVEIAQLAKGVRILVSDGEDIGVTDHDATDGLGRFTLPAGEWLVYARALGRPGSVEDPNCMEINTLLCYDWVDIGGGVYDFVQVNCNGDLTNDKYVLVGYLDVKRTKGAKPHWQNATNDLIGSAGVGGETYFSFLWQIYNDHLRILQLRFYPAPIE